MAKMSFWNLKLLGTAATSSLLLGSAVAQYPGKANNVPLARLAELLQSHGIEVTQQSLTAALHNSDPEVRSLAARKLAEDHIFDAIPQIEVALTGESVPRTRIGMSLALRDLGDPKGNESLRSMCDDPSLKIASVIELVQTLHLIAVSANACAPVVFASLSRRDAVDYRADILALLPGMYRDLPKDQADHAVHVLEGFLLNKDQQPAVHLQASHALVEIGLHSSSAAIRTALSRETDPAIRSRYQEDLNTLEKKPSVR
jgi:hypothetical protein